MRAHRFNSCVTGFMFSERCARQTRAAVGLWCYRGNNKGENVMFRCATNLKVALTTGFHILPSQLPNDLNREAKLQLKGPILCSFPGLYFYFRCLLKCLHALKLTNIIFLILAITRGSFRQVSTRRPSMERLTRYIGRITFYNVVALNKATLVLCKAHLSECNLPSGGPECA